MERLTKTVVLLLVAGIPAAALPFFATSPHVCFTAGPVTYELSPSAASPDYRVRIDSTAPDIRVQMADRPDNADFVLADDGVITAAGNCSAAGTHKTVQIVTGPAADLTIALTYETNADFSIYVHSARVRPQDAAALFALMQRAGQNRTLAVNR